MYIALLSKENLDLSAYEAICLGRLKNYQQHGELLTFSKPFSFERLAYTKNVFKIITPCRKRHLKEDIQNAQFQEQYKGSYAARIINLDKKTHLTENQLGSFIWHRLTKPKVDLEHPKTTYYLIIGKRSAYLCNLIWENTEDFNKRKSHTLPAPHPTGMHPKLARALINILGTRSVLDPFCGAGGILIEAGLMGIQAEGSDLDPSQVKRARINLNHFGLKKIPVKVADATLLKKKKQSIVTDLAYGKNSRISGIKNTYKRFLENSGRQKKRMVIVFPSSINYRQFIPPGFHLEKTFKYYLHKSLSKKIVILAPSYTAPEAHHRPP